MAIDEPLRLLDQLLAAHREAGTEGAARSRATLRRHLESLGYRVEEQSFRFPPSTLLAFPVFGSGLGWLGLLEVPFLVLPLSPVAAPLVWFLGLAGLTALVAGLGAGWSAPGSELREDANLMATRGNGPIRLWIVAHLDTKAQGHSMAGRLVAVWVAAVSIATTTALVLIRLRGTIDPVLAVAGSLLTIVAGTLAGRARLKDHSPGARDNGTGLCAALVAASRCRTAETGFLFTTAEEFGLLGARSWVREQPQRLTGARVLNLDTIDDTGRCYLVYHDDQGKRFAEELSARFGGSGFQPVLRRLPAGILVDSLAFARGGTPAVTISRLDWDTLRVMHTPRDTADGMRFGTAELVGRQIAEWQNGEMAES